MNERVRTYLIEAARQKDKFVYYSDVVRDCELNIDLSSLSGQNELSKTLGDVSVFENANERPLVSAIAIYKDKNKNDHGLGFYSMAQKIGKGAIKDLVEDLYGFTEAARSREFWQNEVNYELHFGTVPAIANSQIPSFFTKQELEFFKQWQLLPYDSEDQSHIDAKNQIMETVWEKSIYLGKRLEKLLPGFSLEAKKIWHKLGSKEQGDKRVHAMQFKHYTWVKLFRNTDKGKQIYFTFGIDVHPDTEAFVFKIDCQRERSTTLSPTQIALCDNLIPLTAKWNEIALDDLLQHDWDSLIELCFIFIQQHLMHYDAIIDAVWGAPLVPTIFKNKLVKREKPKNGFDEMPERKPSFKGVDVDFEAKAKEQKDLGDAGEELVKQHEIEFLESKQMLNEASKVTIVKDGVGFDVLSFDENGNEKHIEVKTTTGNEYAQFYLSENEIQFMRLNKNSYCIYRVYHYDEGNNFGEFYELSGDIESQLIMKPIEFKVVIKKVN